MKENEIYIMIIDDCGSSGEGIGKINGFTIFVENTVIGDEVEIKILKLKKSYGYGKLIKIINPSKHRVIPICNISNKCGGCQLQNYDYTTQLKLKQKQVKDNLERIGNLKNIDVLETIGMDNPLYYRNKAQFPVKTQYKKLQVGFYLKGTHNIINIDTCYIQHNINNKILKIIKEFITKYKISTYDEKTHKGLIRHILTRVSFNTNEIMVCLIINGKQLPNSSELIKQLQTISDIKSIILNYNTNKGNVILGDKIEVLWGNSYIVDYIGNIKFEISPLSFFQVNPIQTEVLYNKILDYAQLTGEEVVLDAYCGIGSISLFIAHKSKKVYGIEIVEMAINDAKINAKINNIDNVEFYVGKAEELIQTINIKPNIVIVDPPRKGCEQNLLETILEMKPNKIIYVSCNSATLARDLKILCRDDYYIKEVQPIDQFPMTTHVETVCLLLRTDRHIEVNLNMN